MTRDQLIFVDAIVRTGSFRAAAEENCRTQPAISKAVKALETEIGFEIFSRSGYRPILTSRGQAFHTQSLIVIKEMVALTQFTRQLETGSEPVFGISVNHICPTDEIFKLLKSCTVEYPDTQLNLFVESGGGAYDRLKENEADICITFEDEPDSGLEAKTLFDITMALVRAPNFQPEIGTAKVSMDSALGYPQAVVRDSSAHPRPESYALFKHKGRQWLVNDFGAKKQIIINGLAWGRMPLHQVEYEIAHKELVPFRIEGVPLREHVSIKATRKRHNTHGPFAQNIWSALDTLRV